MKELSKKLFSLSELARLDKPIGTLLLLWPTLSSFWLLTDGNPSFKLICIFVIGTFLMRSAGCVINDFFDRDLDGSVTRTKNRPLIEQKVTQLEALYFFTFLVSLSALLLLFLNLFSFYMALLGLGLTVIYPLTKRFFPLPQVFLGFAFSWGVFMVSAAQLNSIPFTACLMFLACFFWIIAYDTIYAMIDKEDDLKIGIKSSAITFGDSENRIIILSHVVSIMLWCIVGVITKVNISFYVSLIFVTLFTFHQCELIKNKNPENCFKAFINNNWIGLSIFIGSILGTI